MAAFLAAAKALKNKNNNEGVSSSHVMSVSSGTTNPFNLEEIFKADTERFGKLKEVLQYIFDNLNYTKSEIHRVDIKMQSKFMDISK
jgi:DNA polymerase III sliding clamp (beta) subunit (PCNA family)